MTSLATQLHEIADRLTRLAPSHRDPNRFHEDKSELVGQLRRLAQSNGKRPIEAANDNRPNRSAV
ncbi:hypothetical protein [Rhizobium sp. OAE497]|uniref:hypothetical protein n=1 Tax=Rhizobium sp. OAE497 TaxID=2663796 RepID=UPI0018F69B98